MFSIVEYSPSPFVDVLGLTTGRNLGTQRRAAPKNLSGTGWLGASSATWRGALDPNGDGSGVGPRR